MNNIIVTSASGVEGVTKKELFSLGVRDCSAVNGKIAFEGDELLMARCNYLLRTADKVLWVVSEFTAETFDEVFDGTKNIPWEDYIPRKGKVLVDGKSTKSKLFALSALQGIIKKAILTRMGNAYDTTFFPESGDEYFIEFYLFEDRLTLALNTSGAALHKRGYRDLVGAAPLRETLAAALILLSDKPEGVFSDPLCGSGTLPIEAARIMMNIPSGILRTFAFERYNIFNPNIIKEVREKAAEEINMNKELRISGFDIDPKAVRLAQRHVKNAGLDGYIHIQTQDVKDFRSRYKGGLIVTNPPYGERLGTKEEISLLYKTLGSVYSSLDGWSLTAVTSSPLFERCFGKRADKNRKLYNATLECKAYFYSH